MKKCSDCKYSIQDWTNPENTDCYCSNKWSENYGYNTDYTEWCECGNEKKGEQNASDWIF